MGESFRLGIMGGTFDPIHMGHLATAEAVRDGFGLSEVLFVPSAHPPHKHGKGVASAENRLAMTILATCSNPHFRVSALELRREGPSYAVDTVDALREAYGDGTAIYFITGADAINELATWRHARELLAKCHFLAAARQGAAPDMASLEAQFGALARSHIHGIRTPALEISSTGIRERVREGRSIRYLVPRSVEDYIRKEGLYR